MDACINEPCTSGDEQRSAGVRVVVLNLPEDEGEGLGFRLTRTLWDPYPWVRDVKSGARADLAGLRAGDCLLQADGKDLLGMPVGQVAGLIRGDGTGGGVTLLVWNCGVDPNDDPELLWSCGGGSRGEKSRRALAGVIKALSCCVCAATATKALTCARSHLYCEVCWTRLERCALCRENLPSKDSPYSRNLVAEQVFEAIATEYELKDTIRRTSKCTSAYTSPERSPNISPTTTRRGQYQLSMMNKSKRNIQNNDKFPSDPNIHRTLSNKHAITPNPTKTVDYLSAGNIGNVNCNCHRLNNDANQGNVSQILVEDADNSTINCNKAIQHKLVANLRQACSMADLHTAVSGCSLSKSLNNVSIGNQCCNNGGHSNSLDNFKSNCIATCDPPVYVLAAPQPIYPLACDHVKN
ncbi:PREDICTED: uncharacterized protein LOC106107246 [Papilio polytes]|uniref:uncharacterized protein LOC106107246 n=1 Tax=Papilio polytes TaxID=76194 RepID=UPI0006763242|nr:PREDICTED: uncharacterized protein LOC106107246 [Papilio polytes]